MPLPSNIDDDTLYEVTVLRAVILDPPINNIIMLPNTHNVIKGKVLKTLNDVDVDTAVAMP